MHFIGVYSSIRPTVALYSGLRPFLIINNLVMVIEILEFKYQNNIMLTAETVIHDSIRTNRMIISSEL